MSFHALALVAALFFQGQAKLEIKDIKEGTGRPVQAKDSLTVEYTGTLLDGKVFDSSTGKAPYVFPVGMQRVIKGWDEGLIGMKVGGERQLTIPPDLAYGDQANGEIPAKSTLKFDIKLLRIDREGDKQDLESTVLTPGTGVAAVEGDLIDVHYLGTFVNGVKFDSSYDRKEPLTLLAGHARVIKGFAQGLEGIKLGEKRRLTIPATLGYGSAPRGPIPGGSTLVFEIEAVKITPKAEVDKGIVADRAKLKIEEIAPGTGAEVRNGDIVAVHVVISLPGGKPLYDTHTDQQTHGQPRTYPLGTQSLKRGFEAALIGMKTGQKRKVTVPPDLAFGATANPRLTIPANATVVFEIEVVKINP